MGTTRRADLIITSTESQNRAILGVIAEENLDVDGGGSRIGGESNSIEVNPQK